VVYLPNHSNLDDGLVMFLLSARLGQLFNYVVAYEAFQGLIGKLMQKVGAYSIRRGVGDRYSIVQTLKILQQPQCKLVIFPEGGCSYQNETVMPFRPGAVELSFKAIEKIAKQDTVPNFYLVPVSIKYGYPNSSDVEIERALQRLETVLDLHPQENDFYWRLRNVAERVLTNLETEYHVSPIEPRDWNQRIRRLKERMLDYCEKKLDLSSATALPDRERVYKIQSILWFLDRSDRQLDLDYERIDRTTVRLLNFDAIYDGYVAANPTKERFFATIDRLEREVFNIDRPKFKGWRQAIVKIGTPIDLKKYYLDAVNEEPAVERQEIIDRLTDTLQQTVQANLH
jgi:1-acyl-sn-glycerol-3-phosphate acyltransferase